MQLLNKLELLQFVRERADLFDISERINPFSGSAWTLHFVEQIAENSWQFQVADSQNGGESLMLLYSDKMTPYRLTAVANYYVSLISPLVSAIDSSEARGASLDKLVDQFVQKRPRCAIMDFSPLDKESPDTESLRRALSVRGWYTKMYDCFGNWYLPCANLSFDDYMKSRDSKLVNTWSRKRKKFENAESGGARLEIVVDPGDVSRAMDAYESVYAKSWKKPEPYPNFVRDWAFVCAKNGWLRLGLAWLGDTPIAAQFWFSMHGRAYIFKLAYDESHAKLSAGTVLSAHMFRHALDKDRVVEIDYLTGDDAYKQSWMTKRRQRVGLIACNLWTRRGLLLGAREFAGELVKPFLRKVRGGLAFMSSIRLSQHSILASNKVLE